MTDTEVFKGNSILARLKDAERGEFAPHFVPIETALGVKLIEEGSPATQVFFPTGPMVISLLRQDLSGGLVEVGVVGSEGLASVSSVLDPDAQVDRALVQGEGTVLRVEANVLRKLFASSSALRDSILPFVNYLTIQIAQTALCNRLHKIERRLARWLLMMRDRTGTSELKLTQEFLSHMLGRA